MEVDPRYISEWLRTQWASDATRLIANRRAADAAYSDNAIDFAAMLQMLLSESGVNGNTANGGIPADEALAQLAAANAAFNTAMPYTHDESADMENIDRIVSDASRDYGVDPALVKAVIRAESNFRSDAVSSAGAKGLMQLMDGTARTLGVTDSFDPVQNVRGGTRFLSYLLHKYDGNTGVALAAYNAGPGRVDRLGIRTEAELAQRLESLPEETQRYVGKVLAFREQFNVT
ncbi:lytic transglycosylase domain-containing protein [Paenibacillus alkalitolerans]|uniref:lytic transglycosylase domain-containing protein n=1 Tax=Paenibacillus alkalitolerans TaxID=2799335 RepID=UPI001F40B41D|nr:lytic transglycosylase domain-containing protein [Paenibacillus alkalitolerans]